jgi:hypothetical protein
MVAPLWFAANIRTIPVPLRTRATVRESLAIDADANLNIGTQAGDLRMGLTGHVCTAGDCARRFLRQADQSRFIVTP